ncbi:MAG: hypothetical protein ACLTSG_09130 [Lachnospiraceae bacterium]
MNADINARHQSASALRCSSSNSSCKQQAATSLGSGETMPEGIRGECDGGVSRR